MFANQLNPTEYPSYYTEWIAQLPTEYDLYQLLEVSCHDWIHFVQNVPWDALDYRYAPGKWTIKEITQHLIDCERIFGMRALCFSRGEQLELPGFDENAYQAKAGGEDRHMQDLLQEFSLVRHATLALFKSFSASMLEQYGKVAGNTLSVRAIGFMICAHQAHHQRIYQARYIDAFAGERLSIE